MATITPTLTAMPGGYSKIVWSGVSTADTMTAYGPLQNRSADFASVLLAGTWGSATVTLAGSEDNSTFLTLKDRYNTNISATANARFELSTATAYLKPTSSGGTADNVDVTVILRGK